MQRESFNVVADDLFRIDDFPLFEDLEIRNHHRMQAVFSGAKFHSHNRDFSDERRLQVVSLDFFRINIFPVAENDDFFLPASNKQVVIGIEVAQVPGVEPTIPDGCRRGVGTIPVTLHHDGAANRDLAYRLAAVLLRVRINNFPLDSFERFAYRANYVVVR